MRMPLRPILGLAALLAPPSSQALDARDLLVADRVGGIIAIDADSFEQTAVALPELAASRSAGVALTPDPRNAARRIVWVANEDDALFWPLVGIDESGASAPCFTNAGEPSDNQPVSDVEAASDGSAFWSVGARLFRHHVVIGEPSGFACFTDDGSVDVEGALGARGVSLALREVEGAVVEIFIALGSGGVARYDVGAEELSLVGGIPTAVGDAVFGVAWSDALVFSQADFDGLACTPESGVFAAFLGIGPLAQGGLLRCPVGVAFDPATRPDDIFATDVATALGGEPRVVRLAGGTGGGFEQSIATSGGLLVEPVDVEIVQAAPEPRAELGMLAVIAAAAALRSQRRSYAHCQSA